MTLYGDDSFTCPGCSQHAICNEDLIAGEPFGVTVFECPECGWQGDDSQDWDFYSPYDTREEERGLK